ncbi:anti-repressor SinI family protein [Oceanobacillus sojae]|uniref:anti-repressor SinI family protein n=1 Tax=Oceanobacillus sojae TaxID=582851 RepID=UPI0021A8DADE|nr:anti-repressor SinI family protein [Oceanobacillus sojae]MCT1905181.1 anti-repressor SinI family protein [Oceanobacillus sojae]
MKKIIENAAYDQEWITLMIEAKKLGISLHEVRQFLDSANEKSKFDLFFTDFTNKKSRSFRRFVEYE